MAEKEKISLAGLNAAAQKGLASIDMEGCYDCSISSTPISPTVGPAERDFCFQQLGCQIRTV